MSTLFNEKMSYSEAQKVFFSSVAGKTAEEKNRIREEYRSILPAITNRELGEHPNRMTSHPL